MSITEAINRKNSEEEDEIEIRLSDIILFLKKNRRRIIWGFVIGLCIGALYAFSKPNMYTTEVTVLPESQSKGAGLGSLGSLAGLAGINVDNINSQDAIRPDLYPNVLHSVPFALYLLKQPVYSTKLRAKMTLEEFINRFFANGFFDWLNSFFPASGSDEEKPDPKNFSKAIQVTKKQSELIKLIQTSATAEHDKKTGIITIIAIEPDPAVAATVARLSLDYLTNYVTNYRTEKARNQVIFLSQRVNEAKSNYQSSEYALSSYRDRNRNLYLNTAKIDEQRLQADYLLAQAVYNELTKQLEQAKIKVQEETPVFKTLEPPTVPLKKSGPKRTLIMLGFGVIGVIISLAIALFRRVKRTDRNLHTV